MRGHKVCLAAITSNLAVCGCQLGKGMQEPYRNIFDVISDIETYLMF